MIQKLLPLDQQIPTIPDALLADCPDQCNAPSKVYPWTVQLLHYITTLVAFDPDQSIEIDSGGGIIRIVAWKDGQRFVGYYERSGSTFSAVDPNKFAVEKRVALAERMYAAGYTQDRIGRLIGGVSQQTAASLLHRKMMAS